MAVLIIEPALCVACRGCTTACAVDRHSVSKKMLSALAETPLPVSRIRLGVERGQAMPQACRHCQEAACVANCPAGAMFAAADGTVAYDHGRCIKCFMCVASCAFGACDISTDRAFVLKCDLCPNREVPACADACPTGALTYDEASAKPETAGGSR